MSVKYWFLTEKKQFFFLNLRHAYFPPDLIMQNGIRDVTVFAGLGEAEGGIRAEDFHFENSAAVAVKVNVEVVLLDGVARVGAGPRGARVWTRWKDKIFIIKFI